MKSGRPHRFFLRALTLGSLALAIFWAVLRPWSEPGPAGAAPEIPSATASVAASAAAVGKAETLDAFQAWLAEETRHSQTLAQGLELARARRATLKALIQTDPEAALAHAVPYAVRRDLPAEIIALLETPVSTTADLDVAVACGGPDGRSLRWVSLAHAGRELEVYGYGERAHIRSKQRLSVHGIMIDEVMAMRDDPVRELSPEETADLGFTGHVVQLGKRLFTVESDAALLAARQKLRAAEELIHPQALPAYRDFALGRMEGIYPLAMQDGSDATSDPTADDLPPVAYSPRTEGLKKMLYIRARFADDVPGYEPVTLATAQARQGEAEVFWFENSYGKSSLTTTYTTVVTLPKNGGDYVNNFNTLLADARAAAAAASSDWTHTKFDFYTVITNFATNAQGNGFPYSGVAQLGGPGSHLLRNDIGVRNASHEYGHNLGLNHSGYWLTDSPSPIGADSAPGGYSPDQPDDEVNEYGHLFSVMGSQIGAGDFNGGRAHYTASDKNLIDWLDTADGDIAVTTTSGTFRLYRHDLRSADFASMATGVARAIKIDRPASDPTGRTPPYKYWLNYRLLPTNGIAGGWLPHGIQVDWRRDGGNGFRAVQLDMTPYSRDTGPYGPTPGPAADNADKEDAVLLVGRTFSDTGADIHFTPIAKGGTAPNEWLDVVVNIGTQAANTAPQIQSLTVSNPTPATGETVNFLVSATDANGDTLAYHWDMGDNTVQAPQLNRDNRGKIWNTPGFYTVRVEVSDMKGGKTTASALIQVGTPTNTALLRGRVTHAGRPVEGVFVRSGSLNTFTESDGSYVLAGLAPGSVTVTAFKDGLTFTPQFTNPVQLTELNAFGLDFAVTNPWTGGGGTVAVVKPHYIELPLGFAAQFTAHAFDGSGAPVAFAPTWSVSGGGTINADGVFIAQAVGGPYTVTAQDGPVTATATVTVLPAVAGPAANGTWTNASGGAWPTAGNWAGNTVAGGAGFTADFSTLNPAADATITLDGARVIGNLVFGDTATATAASWTLEAGAGGSLTLAGASPTITVNALATGKFARITAPLNGLNGFTKTGAGNLLLNNNANTLSGPVILAGGNIQLNSASLSNATSVALDGGSLVLATAAANAVGGTISFDGGTMQFSQTPLTDYSARFSTAPNQQYRINVTSTNEVTFGSDLASPGGTLTKLNTGTLTLAVANSYTGGTTLGGGTLIFGNADALGAGALSFVGNSTLQAGGAFTLANTINIAAGIAAGVDTNNHNPTLGGAITGTGTFAKLGAGALNLGGGAANTFSGPILVNAGTLTNDNVTPSPGIQSLANMNGPITVASGATFSFSQSFTGDNLDNDLSLGGAGTGGLGALNLWRNATVTGAITLVADTTISKTFNSATIAGPIGGADHTLTLSTLNSTQPGLLISGPVQLGEGGVTIVGAGGTGVITLSGALAYTGDTRVQSGTLRLTGDARIHDSTTVRVGSGATLQLDFADTDTVAALFLDGVAMPDGTYGSETSAAANKSAYFTGVGMLRVGATVADTYASWAATQVPPVTGGPEGDDDHDGVKNLVEYALVEGGERGQLNGAVLTFTKRGAPYGGDLTYIIEVSTTLAADSWTPVVTHGPAEMNLPTITYTLAPTPGTPRIFARLRVMQIP